MSTTPSSQGSLVAPMLVLVGPLLSLGAAVVAAGSAGALFDLIQAAGALALVAIVVSFVVTFAVAAIVSVGSRGGSPLVALAAPLSLVPWAVMVAAAVLGTTLVAAAVAGVELDAQPRIAAQGSAELMAARTLGAAMVFGGALALSAAMLSLARVPGSALAALLLVGVAAVALVVLADATVLRRGLSAASQADVVARPAVLGQTLIEARISYQGLLAVLSLTTLLGCGAVLAGQRAGKGGALVAGTTWLVLALFGGADVALLHYVSATLAIPAPWESEPNFAPLTLEGQGTTAVRVACLATLTRVRCHDGDGAYDSLEGVLPQPLDAGAHLGEGMEPGVTFAGLPALTVALDARVPAPSLRQLLLAAVRAGYRSLTVVGARTLPAFRDGDVPPLLRTQALTMTTASWLLALAVSEGGDGLLPIVIDVRDDDTAESVARRASAVVDQSVLVLPAPLPTVRAPAPSVADLAGLRDSDAAPEVSPAPLDAPAISRVIRAHNASVRACYQRGLVTNPDLGGRVMVRFTIAPSGVVSDAAASPTLSSDPVLRCIEVAVARMLFPADPAREPITVNYPFVFSSTAASHVGASSER